METQDTKTRQGGENGDKTGKYGLVARIYDANIDGDTVVVDIYITGYSRILNSSWPCTRRFRCVRFGLGRQLASPEAGARWGGPRQPYRAWRHRPPQAPPDRGQLPHSSMSATTPPRILTGSGRQRHHPAPVAAQPQAKIGDYCYLAGLRPISARAWQTSCGAPAFTVRNVFQQADHIHSQRAGRHRLDSAIFRVGYSLWGVAEFDARVGFLWAKHSPGPPAGGCGRLVVGQAGLRGLQRNPNWRW
jgi:hypothetical protein